MNPACHERDRAGHVLSNRARAHGRAVRAGLRRRSGRPADARCESRRSGTSRTRPGSSKHSSSKGCPSTRRSSTCSTATTRPSDRRIERARRGSLTRPSLDRVHAYRREIDRRIGKALGDRLIRRAGPCPSRAWPAPRAAAPGADPHRSQVHARDAAARAGLPGRPRPHAARRCGAPLRWRRFDGGVTAIGAAERWLRVRQRAPAARRDRAAVRAGESTDLQRRGARVHRRRWLSTTTGSGSAMACTWSSARAGARRCTGRGEADVLRARWHARRSSPPRPRATSATTRPTRSHAGLGGRLPTEAEWELAAAGLATLQGNFADDGRLHPSRADVAGDLAQMFGDVWEWTSSSVLAVPGLPPARRCARRVQRQVHVGSAGAARRLLLHAARSRPRHLSQLLPAGRTLADEWCAAGEGRLKPIHQPAG